MISFLCVCLMRWEDDYGVLDIASRRRKEILMITQRKEEEKWKINEGKVKVDLLRLLDMRLSSKKKAMEKKSEIFLEYFPMKYEVISLCNSNLSLTFLCTSLEEMYVREFRNSTDLSIKVSRYVLSIKSNKLLIRHFQWIISLSLSVSISISSTYGFCRMYVRRFIYFSR